MHKKKSVVGGLAAGMLLALVISSFALAAGPVTKTAASSNNCANCPHGVCTTSAHTAMNAKDCSTGASGCPYGIKNCPVRPNAAKGSRASMKLHSSTKATPKKSAAGASAQSKSLADAAAKRGVTTK